MKDGNCTRNFDLPGTAAKYTTEVETMEKAREIISERYSYARIMRGKCRYKMPD